MNNKPNIAVIGTGYVGLVSGTCFADLGFKVICVDKDKNKIKNLKNGNPTIYEPSLAPLMQSNLLVKTLKFTTSLPKAVSESDFLFITVGTPVKNSTVDLSEIENIVKELAPLLKKYKIIVVKSTVPVGTCRKLSKIIRELNPNALFDMVSNPEFLRAGSSVEDFMTPNRIIIGTENNTSYALTIPLYQSFIDKKIPIIKTTLESAELTKYASNGFLATKLAFTNEIASLCEKVNANVNDVLEGMGLDPRIGKDYLKPGPGFGGSCLAKDALALTQMAKNIDSPISIVESALKSNIHHKQKMVEKIIAACSGSVNNKKLAILGISFKANTDDIRESPSLYVISELEAQGAKLNLYDPIVKKIPFDLNIYWGRDIEDTLNETDAVIIMTEWDEFAELDLKKVKACLRNTVMEPTLIDFRNLYPPDAIKKARIRYYSNVQSNLYSHQQKTHQ